MGDFSFFDIVVKNSNGWFTGAGTQLIVFVVGYWLGKKNEKKELVRYVYKEMEIDYGHPTQLSVGASGCQYVSPSNGMFKITSEGRVDIFIDGVKIHTSLSGTTSLRILKGQKFHFQYSKPIQELIFYNEKK